jgi:hypothetical protein
MRLNILNIKNYLGTIMTAYEETLFYMRKNECEINICTCHDAVLIDSFSLIHLSFCAYSSAFTHLCSYLILSVLPYFIIVFMWLKVQPLSYMTRNKYYGCRVSKYESKGKEKIEKKEVSNDILNSNIINC